MEELHRMIGRIEGKLDGMDAKLDSVMVTQEKHADRIGSLEIMRVQALTIVGAVTFGLNLFWDTIKGKLGL